MGHVEDAYELGAEGFWNQVENEGSLEWQNRPSEIKAEEKRTEIMSEMEASE